MGYGTGGVLMAKKKFDSLSEEQKGVLKKLSNQHLQGLVQKTKQDNEKFVKAILKSGVALAQNPPPEELKEFQQAGAIIRRNLGKLFFQDPLLQIMSYLKEAR